MKRFFDSLYGRIAGAYLVLLLLFCTLSIIATLQASRRFTYESDQNLNRDLASVLYERIRPNLEDGPDVAALKEAFSSFMQVNPRVDIYLLDAEGRILASSVATNDLQLHRVKTGPITRFVDGHSLPLLGEDPRDLHQQKIFSAYPVEIGSETGFVYVVLLSKLYDSVASLLRDDFILRTAAANLLLVFLFTGLAGLLVFAFITRSFRRITRMVESLEEGQLDRRIEKTGSGELGRLSHTLNDMADMVQQHMEILQERDDFRREFLANISHDLRSPITSIQGYVETAIMKNATLSEKERLGHLKIIHEETTRLDSLIAQLLELARLEASRLHPDAEPFAVPELVQDVLIKFRPTAERKKVQLRATLPNNLPLVEADIGMIERVLSNLVDNAIEHTRPGGLIAIDGTQIDHRIRITLADTGMGISEHDLPHVTERFYRGEGSLRSGGGTGLGLAIADRIVALHGSRLTIESSLGKGTTVSFMLPVA